MSGSAGRLLELIRTGTATTRRELLEHTGLSRSTVAARVDQLIAAGFVREAVTETGARGRPTAVLTFDHRHGVVLAADLGARHARATVCDLAGNQLAETTQMLRIADGPDVCIGWLQKAWRQLLEQAGPDLPPLVGAGVSVPGPVDAETGRPVRPPIMPGWHDHPIKERLEGAFGVPALVDNDANLMALGESLSVPPSCTSMLFVKVATGIGAGVIANRQLVRGRHGGAGDIGHVRITSDGDAPPCACGARGCLAATASGGAIARALAEQGVPVTSSRDAFDLAHTGEPRAVELLRRSALQLGEVLATAVSLLNPEMLVIGGDAIRAQEHFMPALQERLYQRTQPLASQDLLVTTSALGDRAGIVGAVVMVVDSVYSAAAVDRALAAA